MFLVEVGLTWGDDEPDGLWIVRVRKSSVFLCNKKSRSLPTKFVGKSSNKLGGVMLFLGPLARLGEGDRDGMYIIWEVKGTS